MSAVQVGFVAFISAVAVSTLVRCALVVYAVLIALNTSNAKRRQVAVRVLRMLGPALSIKLGHLEVTRAQVEDTPERRELSE